MRLFSFLLLKCNPIVAFQTLVLLPFAFHLSAVHHDVLHSDALHHAVLHHAGLRSAVLHHSVLRRTIFCKLQLHSFAPVCCCCCHYLTFISHLYHQKPCVPPSMRLDQPYATTTMLAALSLLSPPNQCHHTLPLSHLTYGRCTKDASGTSCLTWTSRPTSPPRSCPSTLARTPMTQQTGS